MEVGAELDRWTLLELRVSDSRGTPEENDLVCRGAPEENDLVLTDLLHRAQVAHDRAWAQTGHREPSR